MGRSSAGDCSTMWPGGPPTAEAAMGLDLAERVAMRRALLG
ncbi:hypothetical protein [Micromonospora rhizosphaerae]|nr:hypothetical protein [Micromonospora rhizosphaerae]